MKVVLWIVLGIQCGCYFFTGLEAEDYDNCRVYRLKSHSEMQYDCLCNLLLTMHPINFWTKPNTVGKPVDIMVCSENLEDFLDEIDKFGINYSVIMDNVQRVIDEQSNNSTEGTDHMTWKGYPKLEAYYAWLVELSATHKHVHLIDGGNTFEGRDILGVKVSFGPHKRAVMLEGGIHAREWISPSTVTFILKEIIYSQDPLWREIAESYDWYIFPVTNPDGYAYSQTKGNRLWRKTRTPNENVNGTQCFGIDGNRNWPAKWGVYGTSTNPCDDIYGGMGALTDVAMASLAEFIRTIAHSLDVYFSFHSYSQLLMVPFGYTTEHLANYNQTIKVAQSAVKTMAMRNGTNYTTGAVGSVTYLASGNSVDWVKQEFDVPLVMTYELRDRGQYGFLLPADQIIPNCLEVMDSLVTIFMESKKLGIL